MEKVKGYFKIMRPVTSFSGALAILLGGYVARTGAWFEIILATVIGFLLAGAANAWNDYRDIEIDRINQPQRALPAGMINLQEANWFALILNAVAILLSLAISGPAVLMTLAFTLILYVYSWRLKSTVLLGNCTIALVSAMTVIFGGVAAGNPRPTLWLAVIIWVAILGREVLKTIADYEGDLGQQCRTIATVWGKSRARLVFYGVMVVSVMAMMLPHWLQLYRPVYAYIVILGVFPVLAYVLWRVRGDSSGRQLENLSQLLKYDFFVWFIAVILGAAR